MSALVLIVGLALALGILTLLTKVKSTTLMAAVILAAGLVVLLSFALASVRFVGAGEIGIVKKNALGPKLTDGRIVATGGEMGIQAEVLPPGWHLWYWPVIYDIEKRPLIEIRQDQVGLIEARDGEPLARGQLFAPEVAEDEFKRMIDNAEHFLTSGGRKGPQSNVLKPGKYRINTELFNWEPVSATDVPNASVAVLKANFGDPPSVEREVPGGGEPVMLADEGQRGVRVQPLPPGKYPINTKAFDVTIISTKETIVRFTKARGNGGAPDQVIEEEREITVRTSDGFTFPVDVRIEYRIEESNAPIVVAKLRNEEGLRSKLNSTVRAIFRNNAESVKALDYVNQRSLQESQSLQMLRDEMSQVGVLITGVRIGDVGDEETLGELLKTQRDREIAVQEQITFQEQQKAAEQKKELTRTQQEAEEEMRLATATYAVQIAEQEQQRRIIQAKAEAEAITIEAQAQADAYKMIAQQIGSGNAALIELLKIVGERGIQITPRVMVNTGGSNGSEPRPGVTTGAALGGSPETVALIGTMLDAMVSRDEPAESDR